MKGLPTLAIALLLGLPLPALPPLARPLLAHPGHSHATAAAKEMTLEDYEVGSYPIGGDFTLTNQDGGKTRLKDFRGKAVLLAFGYTNCPDVCPATMALFKQVKQALGADAARMTGVFISVDPARDTPAVLKKFVGAFDPRFSGLTGSEAEVGALIERFMGKSIVRKSPKALAAEVDHTAFIYLLDPKGKVRYLFTVDAPRDVLAAGVRAVLRAS